MTNSERIKLSMAIGMLEMADIGANKSRDIDLDAVAAIKNTLSLLRSMEREAMKEAANGNRT